LLISSDKLKGQSKLTPLQACNRFSVFEIQLFGSYLFPFQENKRGGKRFKK
jgi:hypothetical protein